MKRNRSPLCAYVTVPVRQRPTRSMQGRLQHLEKFVINMLNEQGSRNGSSPPDSIQISSSGTSATQNVRSTNIQELRNYSTTTINSELRDTQMASAKETLSGQIVLGMNETAYVGATHWAAILDDVKLKRNPSTWFLF